MTPHRQRLAPALSASVAAHLTLVLLAILLISRHAAPAIAPAPPVPTKFVFMEQSGAIGGGGGSPRPAPPRPVEIPPHRPVELIAVRTTPDVEPPPVPVLDAPVLTNAAAVIQATGTSIVSLPGPGGGGPGTGAGPGRGPGVGPGELGGTGGGPRRIGAGVTPPVPIYRAQPQYTTGAMQAKITGEVLVELVVLADGTVGSARILRSLDRRHGLDDEAVRTAKLWRFQPATAAGKPIDVIVTLALQFRIY